MLFSRKDLPSALYIAISYSGPLRHAVYVPKQEHDFMVYNFF